MKKRYILPIVPVLFTITSATYPVGWPMPSNTMQTISQVVFWVSLSAIPVVSLFAYWDKIYGWFPVIRFEYRRRARRTEDLIVRQIIKLSASPLISGIAECVDVSVIFPSFLPKPLELAKVRGYITIDGHATDEQEFRSMTIFDRSPNEVQLRVALTPSVSTRVRERVQTNNQVEVSFHLTGWDVKNIRYDLSTRGWTTRFLY